LADFFSGDMTVGDFVQFSSRSGPAGMYPAANVLASSFYNNFTNCANPNDHLKCPLNKVSNNLTKSFQDVNILVTGTRDPQPGTNNPQ
jgi:hypothetical protein